MVPSRHSKQSRWQQEREAEGRCRRCGKPRHHYANYCDACGLKARRRRRTKVGSSQWHPGGPGRPPLTGSRNR
jgi:ribosomal protein L37E